MRKKRPNGQRAVPSIHSNEPFQRVVPASRSNEPFQRVVPASRSNEPVLPSVPESRSNEPLLPSVPESRSNESSQRVVATSRSRKSFQRANGSLHLVAYVGSLQRSAEPNSQPPNKSLARCNESLSVATAYNNDSLQRPAFQKGKRSKEHLSIIPACTGRRIRTGTGKYSTPKSSYRYRYIATCRPTPPVPVADCGLCEH